MIRRIGGVIINYEKPYIEEEVKHTVKKYNPKYGDDRMCRCGHTYYRHFDTYDNMKPIGCKFCGCHEFIETKVINDGKNRCVCCGKEIEEKYLKVCDKCASEYEF